MVQISGTNFYFPSFFKSFIFHFFSLFFLVILCIRSTKFQKNVIFLPERVAISLCGEKQALYKVPGILEKTHFYGTAHSIWQAHQFINFCFAKNLHKVYFFCFFWKRYPFLGRCISNRNLVFIMCSRVVLIRRCALSPSPTPPSSSCGDSSAGEARQEGAKAFLQPFSHYRPIHFQHGESYPHMLLFQNDHS